MGYLNVKKVTIDYTKVPNSDQSNFPMLFAGTYAYLATEANGGGVKHASGYDIIFSSDIGGSVVLDFERVSWSATTGQCEFWVKIPTLSHETNTIIYLLYGNSDISVDQQDAEGTWDDDFAGVWHLEENAFNYLDSTQYDEDLNVGVGHEPTRVTGKFSYGQQFNGSDDYIANNSTGWDQIPYGEHVFSFSLWFKFVSFPADNNGVCLGGWGGTSTRNRAILSCWRNPGSSGPTMTCDYGGGFYAVSDLVDDYDWHYLVVYLPTASDISTTKMILDDGAPAAGGNLSGAINIGWGTTDLSLGKLPSASQWYANAVLDEVHISRIARSADWFATEYNNQSSPSTFYSISDAGGVILNPNLTGGFRTIAGGYNR